MKLPSSDRALIEPAKVRDYLLDLTHPVGRFKAVFFESLGFTARNWEELSSELMRLASTHEAIPTATTRYGRKYEVRGRIEGPGGRSELLVSVWIVLDGQDYPRFVTAFPGSWQ